ncbi:MAG: septum formation initiator family protein [Tissierellia bacterium]|nr:septum formation initiator family protein [Tissierellia bacterium]
MEARVRKPKIYQKDNEGTVTVNNKIDLNLYRVKKNKKRKAKAFTKISYALIVLAIFFSGLVVLTGYTSITSNKTKLHNLDLEIAELEKQLTSLSGKIETLKTDANIVEEAQYKLGMVYPDESQIVYFTFEDFETKEPSKEKHKIIDEIQAMIKSFTDSY